MSACRDIAPLITPYIDRELAEEKRDDVDRHIAACPPCRTRLSQEQGACLVVRRSAARLSEAPLPPGLESRCQSLVAGHAAPRAVVPWRWLVSAAALVVLGVVISLPTLTRQSNALLAAQLSADHMKCFTVFTPRDSTGREAAAAERQLAAHGWEMHVPPSSPEHDLQLLGVRRCIYAEGAVPHVMYTLRGRPMSLYFLDSGARQAAVMDSFGQQCRIWQRDGRTFVLVASADAGSLDSVASYVEQEAR
jgi:anti-sigma factor RsiW